VNSPAFADLRERLKSGRAALAAAFLERPAATPYLSRHAALVDSVLCELSTRLNLPATFCLAAVGGYGRGELFPGSDVDLLLLLPHEPSAEQQATLENWVQACWDIGLEIGHSVRTVEACLLEAEQDITVETNLFEARFLWGGRPPFEEFGRRFQARLKPQRFFEGKLAEQQARYGRAVEEMYCWADELLGRLMAAAGDDTTLPSAGVNYLIRGQDLKVTVDWSRASSATRPSSSAVTLQAQVGF